MDNQLIVRKLTFRPRTADGAGEMRELFVSLGVISLSAAQSPVGPYECIVTTGPSPLFPTSVFGRDPVGALIAALGAVESYCQMLSALGELWLEDGTPFDLELDGLKIVEKRIWAKGFIPPFLTARGDGNSSE